MCQYHRRTLFAHCSHGVWAGPAPLAAATDCGCEARLQHPRHTVRVERECERCKAADGRLVADATLRGELEKTWRALTCLMKGVPGGAPDDGEADREIKEGREERGQAAGGGVATPKDKVAVVNIDFAFLPRFDNCIAGSGRVV